MKELEDIIIQYESVFYNINILEVVLGVTIMILSPLKKGYSLINFIIAIYLGIGIGSAIGFELLFSVAGMLVGMCIGSIVALLITFTCGNKINYALFALVLKTTIIVICNYFSNELHYSVNNASLMFAIVISLIICIGEYLINRKDSIRYLYNKYLYAIFGILEVSAGIVCWHRYDLCSVMKFLTNVDYYYFFTYLWKIDMSIAGQSEDWFIMIMLILPVQVVYMIYIRLKKDKKATV